MSKMLNNVEINKLDIRETELIRKSYVKRKLQVRLSEMQVNARSYFKFGVY